MFIAVHHKISDPDRHWRAVGGLPSRNEYRPVEHREGVHLPSSFEGGA